MDLRDAQEMICWLGFFPACVYVWYWIVFKSAADRIADVLFGSAERIPGVKYSLDSRMWFRGYRPPPETERRIAVTRIKVAATLLLIITPLVVLASLLW